jgi:OPA family sugar phosphate sensor protein UhpC-like MFS transporter
MIEHSEQSQPTVRMWRVRILTTTWLSYAGFYFCRKNFAIAKSSIMSSMEIGRSDVAHLFTAYLAAYMLGQFLTGFMGRRVATRMLLLTGMGMTLLCNVAFGFSYLMGPAGYWPFLILMIVNGFAQSTGWPGNVGVLGNWLERRGRGRVMALWATCYQLGSILAKVFAAFMIAVAGAAWSFWGASIIMLGVWLLFYFFQRDNPEDVGLSAMVEEVEVPKTDAGPVATEGLFAGWTRQVVVTIFLMGGCYFTFKFLRYALDSWGPLAIEELFGTDAATAGYISTVFDWIGFAGVLVAGWASDRFYAGRRYQTILLMTVGMVLAFAFLAVVGMNSLWLFAIGLSLCGFMLMGPDSLIAGVGAIDIGGRRGAIVAAGLINGVGSIGPIFQEEVIGWVLDNYGYRASLSLLVGMAVLAVIGTAILARRCRKNLASL